MNYYSIEFGYELQAGVRSRIYSDGNSMVHINMGIPEGDKEMTAAMSLANRALDSLQVEHIHEYSWPGDGNFYIIARTKMSKDVLRGQLENKWKLRVNKFWPCDPNDKKYRMDSPKETFERLYRKRVTDAETFLTTANRLGLELSRAQLNMLLRGIKAKDLKDLKYLLKDF